MVRSALAVVFALLLAATGCGAAEDPGPTPSSPTPAPPELMLDFETGLETGQQAVALTNAGTGSVQVSVHSAGDAQVTVVAGPNGGHALRFPAFTGAAVAPAAVVVVTAPDKGALDPEDGDFSFGASFRLDPESSGSAADNGDNLVQRGTYSSPGQYKLQVDHDVPSCRIVGTAGEAFVEAAAPIDTERWYSATCERNGSKVILTVTAEDGGAGGGTWAASAPTGTISLGTLPLSVGGKTGPDGVPVASADQFNGAVDDVFLRLG